MHVVDCLMSRCVSEGDGEGGGGEEGGEGEIKAGGVRRRENEEGRAGISPSGERRVFRRGTE